MAPLSYRRHRFPPEIIDQGITGRTANTLTDPIDEACYKDEAGAVASGNRGLVRAARA
jgi:hypothetical protein